MTLALIDYGAGNLRSVENALRAAGCDDLVVTADTDVVAAADRIVLPGVGAFGACIGALRAIDGMEQAMAAAVQTRGVPFLGVCVGMQLLATQGEEHGVHAGLGWIPGSVSAMVPSAAARVPHMGWNDVVPARPHAMLSPGEAYFLHGYRFDADDAADVLAKTQHGGPVTAAVARDTVIGVQFHPEKSQSYGLAFLSRFLEWRP
ncbi:imidazole glycerol phosphate synthase subunit HisH [Sphingomonas arantia]|uniref:Imidazole glycerol phosphate synthase subunit HisH n=1 Tax=Sphingomonas arantia TaxID=1460676 RepID=A0ABW4U128_9SPHN